MLPPLFALVQFDTCWQAVVLFVALQAILFVVGNVILPRMQGDSLNIDPVVVLLSLAFWGAIWGVAGMFLSTPLTVMAMVILAQFAGTRWIAVLLSADGEPEHEHDAERRQTASAADSRARQMSHNTATRPPTRSGADRGGQTLESRAGMPPPQAGAEAGPALFSPTARTA